MDFGYIECNGDILNYTKLSHLRLKSDESEGRDTYKQTRSFCA